MSKMAHCSYCKKYFDVDTVVCGNAAAVKECNEAPKWMREDPHFEDAENESRLRVQEAVAASRAVQEALTEELTPALAIASLRVQLNNIQHLIERADSISQRAYDAIDEIERATKTLRSELTQPDSTSKNEVQQAAIQDLSSTHGGT